MEPAPFHDVPPGGLRPDRVWWMTAPDGVRLRAAHWAGQGGDALCVLLNGRTEFIEIFEYVDGAWCLTARRSRT